MSQGLLPRQLPLHLVRFGRLHPRMVVAFAVVAWVVAGLLASTVEVETDILSLVPRNNPVVEGFRTTVERFGSVDTLLVVIHINGDEPIESTLEFAEIVGIGVDYGVHLLHRWYESGGIPDELAETAKAIAVAALTTMVGFGSLVLSHYPGLRSVGAAAILGALSTAILGITVLPALLSMGED